MDVSTVVHSLLTGLRYNKVYIGNNTQLQKSNITVHLNGYACCLGNYIYICSFGALRFNLSVPLASIYSDTSFVRGMISKQKSYISRSQTPQCIMQ